MNKTFRDLVENQKGDYMLLSRLQQDCDYFLGNGHSSDKKLWAGNIEDQIKKMKDMYNSLKDKPDWISLKDIDKYHKDMLKAQN